MKTKIFPIIAVVALIVSVIAIWPRVSSIGAAGGLLIENYIPAIMYNGGYASAKPITLSGADGDITTGDDLTVTDEAFVLNDLTVTDDVNIVGRLLNVSSSNTSTSTITVGCYESNATSSATAVRLVFSTVATSSPTYTGTNTVGLIGWQYGNCPI